MKWLLLSLFFLLGSCVSTPKLNVTTLKVDRSTLASFQTNCYDLRLDSPPIGQKLLISWRIPENIEASNPYTLHGVILLRNYEERAIDYTIEKPIDFLEYLLLNDEFFTTKGILSYRINLYKGETLIETCQHPLFTEIIRFDAN